LTGPTGLEEWIGAGIGMPLGVSFEKRALVFRSVDCIWRLGSWRLRFPDWMTPGRIDVIHLGERHGQFSFSLSVVHPLFGDIIYQIGFFRDAF
jgi:hypothetical protein